MVSSTDDKDLQFTCLTYLVLLEPVVKHRGYDNWMVNLIDRYFRVLVEWQIDIGYMDTTTPNEPIVSYFAGLMLTTKDSHLNRDICLSTLAEQLWHDGSVNRGNSGEVYVRILFMLAMHSIEDYSLQERSPFTLLQLLAMSGSDQEHEDLFNQLPTQILSGKINYNHFTHYDGPLHLEKDGKLCDWLLSTFSAAQFQDNQEAFDCGIPYEYVQDGLMARALVLCQVKLLKEKASSPAVPLCSGNK